MTPKLHIQLLMLAGPLQNINITFSEKKHVSQIKILLYIYQDNK